MLGTLANPRRQSPKASACETLAGLCHHTEVLLSIGTPCGALTKRKLENSTSTSRDRTRLLPTELRDTTTGNFLVNKKTMIDEKKSNPEPSSLELETSPQMLSVRSCFFRNVVPGSGSHLRRRQVDYNRHLSAAVLVCFPALLARVITFKR